MMVQIHLVHLSSTCNNHILFHHSIQERHRVLTWAEFHLKGVNLRRFHCIITLSACFRNLHRNLNSRAFTKAWTIKTSTPKMSVKSMSTAESHKPCLHNQSYVTKPLMESTIRTKSSHQHSTVSRCKTHTLIQSEPSGRSESAEARSADQWASSEPSRPGTGRWPATGRGRSAASACRWWTASAEEVIARVTWSLRFHPHQVL